MMQQQTFFGDVDNGERVMIEAPFYKGMGAVQRADDQIQLAYVSNVRLSAKGRITIRTALGRTIIAEVKSARVGSVPGLIVATIELVEEE